MRNSYYLSCDSATLFCTSFQEQCSKVFFCQYFQDDCNNHKNLYTLLIRTQICDDFLCRLAVYGYERANELTIYVYLSLIYYVT